METLTAAGLGDDLVVSSFSAAVLSELRRQFPGVTRALVTAPGSSALSALSEVLAWGHHELHGHAGSVMAQPRVVGMAHAANRALLCWDVQRLVDARLLRAAGVSGLIVDDPGGMSRGLADAQPLLSGSSAW